MSQILQKLRDVDPNDSDAVKEVITTFFQNLPKHTELNCNIWLRVLEDVVSRFPRYCSQHRSTIENYLAHFLDSSNYYNVIEAAKCAHGLQQIRPSQDKTATPKNCWREQMTILCNTAHTLIEALFSKTVDIYKNSKTVKKKDASLLANTPLTQALSRILNVKKAQGVNGDEKKTVLCTKLRNIFVFIQAMLVEVYPVAKPIQPQLILEVIVQALSVSSSVNTNVYEASIVKIQALRTLDALVSCLGQNLIPFSALVFRFVMQTLRWSSENSNEESRKVRCTAYASLSRWLSTLHVQRAPEARGRAAEDELARLLLGDVTPAKKIVQLTMSNQHTKNLSKKARRKLANTMLQQSTIANHMPGEKNKADVSEEQSDEVAIAALECAEMYLTVCGIFLKPTTHKMFQERLVRECFSLSSYSAARSSRLLRALDAARRSSPGSLPPPTQYCVQLYSTLVNSPCDEVRKFCSQALLDIRLHLHCSPPSLNFALEDQPDSIKDKAKRNEISKKNRAALEALLGKDKMPQEIVDEEVSSAGEPSNKKARLEDDVATRISISSESEASVVISDDSDDDIEEIVEQSEATEEPGTDRPEISENVDPSTKTIQTTIQNDKFVQIIIESIEDTEASVNSSKTNEDNGKIDSSAPEATNIHDAKTQVALNVSTDTIDGEKSPVSMEVAYDLPNTDKKVTVPEKMDDENLPSTNDTDDIQITCGQVTQNSQGLNTKDRVEVEVEVSMPETNGTGELNDAATNGDEQTENVPTDNIEVKITSKEVTVEDMLADFVDEVKEVNEEPSLVV